MKKISEILGKNMISIFEGKKIGIIENAVFDKKLKKLKSLIIYDEDNEQIDRLCVPAASIKLDGSAVMIKNLERVTHEFVDEDCNPMNASVYNLSGNFLGKVSEIILDEETMQIHSLILSDNSVLQEQIVSSDFKTIVISMANEAVPAISAPKRRTVKKPSVPKEKTAKKEIPAPKAVVIESRISKESPVVEKNKTEEKPAVDPAVDDERLNENQNTKKDEVKNENVLNFETEKNKIIVPVHLNKLCANFNYLIGRRVEEDVYNLRGEKIAKRNSIITSATLETCKKWGKLIMLAKSSIKW